jgi:hypothetical protein
VAAAYAAVLAFAAGTHLPLPGPAALAWAATGAVGQIGGTYFLLKALEARNFAVGVAYSKTDVVQAALFEALVMGAAVTWGAAAGIAIATFAVMLMSARGERPLQALLHGLGERSALFGLLSGASLALSGVAVRGTVLAMADADIAAASVVALLVVLTLQTVAMGGFLLVREPRAFRAIAAQPPISTSFLPCVPSPESSAASARSAGSSRSGCNRSLMCARSAWSRSWRRWRCRASFSASNPNAAS